MTNILEMINGIVWGQPMLMLILGVGLFLTFRTGFAQLRLFPKAWKQFWARLLEKKQDDDGVSPYQALCTALAATVGTGNLAGVAGAIAIGGPGSVFWMWICGLLGMITKYAEAALAVRYQVSNADGTCSGGPMYMISRGLDRRWHWLSRVYCFFGVVAAFGVGNCTQINAMVTGVRSTAEMLGFPWREQAELILGIVLAGIVISMLWGGARHIGRLAEKLVPFAAGLYILLSFGVLVLYAHRIPDAFRQIFLGAFSPEAVTGGVIGSCFQTLRIGISRGVFTNEAGMGTAAIAHGSARSKHPVQQGMMGIMEVFLDTILICTLTALVIIVSGVEIPYGVDHGIALTIEAFAAVYGDWAQIVIVLETCCFAFATVLGWGLYGGRCAQYLFGDGAWKSFALFQGVFVIVGAVLTTGTVWLFADIVNALMAIPNLCALVLLSPELVRLTKEYRNDLGRKSAKGGTYEYFHQRKPLRALSHAEIPSSGCKSQGTGQNHLSPEHRSARSVHTSGIL